MTKFIALVLCLFIGSKSFSQSDYDRFYPMSETNVSVDDARVKAIFSRFPQITNFGLDETSGTSLETRSGYLTIVGFKLTNTYSFASIVYNSQSDDYILYFSTVSTLGENKKTKIYDEGGVYLYEVGLELGKVVITTNSDSTLLNRNTSCFSTCFAAQEENFENTFTGWIAWNTHPHVQLIAAGNCQGCCKGWWNNAGCH